ncbi:hypothetical protein ScPMuIL_006728 [Solemya velum]
MTANSFTIDNAFQSDDDDQIRLYGSTNESSTLNGPKVRESNETNDIPLYDLDLQIHPQRNTAQSLFSNQELKHSKSPALRTADSLHSVSSIWTQETHVSFPPNSSWLLHPKVRENWRTVVGAFGLTVIGLVLNLTGIGVLATPQRGWHCVVFFVGGMLCLIPGAYHLVYIYCAVTGQNGYSLYDLPVFN